MRRHLRRYRYIFALAWSLFLVTAGCLLTLRWALRPEVFKARVSAELVRWFHVPPEYSQLDVTWRGGVELRDLKVATGLPKVSYSAPEVSESLPTVAESLRTTLRSETRLAQPQAPEAAEFLSVDALVIVPQLLGLLRGRLNVARLVLDSPRVRLLRGANGRWNFEDVLRPGVLSTWLRGATGPGRPPDLVVRSGRVIYEDKATFPSPLSLLLEDVSASVGVSAEGTVAFRLECRLDSASVEVSGIQALEEGRSVARGRLILRKIDFSRLERFLPSNLAGELRSWSPEGFADLSGEFVFDSSAGLNCLETRVRVLSATLSPPRWPYPLKRLRGSFRIGTSSLEVVELEGNTGSGSFSATGRVQLARPWFSGGNPFEDARWEAAFALRSLVIEPRLRAHLSPGLERMYDAFQPAAKLDVDLRVASSSFPPCLDEIVATLRLTDAGFCYHEFPYRLSGLSGEVAIEKGRWSFRRPLEGRDGPTQVTVTGRGAELRTDGEVDLTIQIAGVPFGERFRGALPSDVRATWDAFQIAGEGDGEVRITRDAGPGARCTPASGSVQGRNGGGGPAPPPEHTPRRADVRIEARPRDLRISYRGFPYEIRGITGKVDVDLSARRVSLQALKGRHGRQIVSGEGVLEYGRQNLLELALHSEDLSVDEDIVSALSGRGRQVLDDFGFKGRVAVDIDLRSGRGRETTVSAELSLIEGEIRHKAVPYLLQLKEGRLKVRGDQTIEWSGVSTPAGSKPYVVLGGRSTAEGDERTLGFTVDISQLEFDEKLLRALPPELEKLVGNLQLGGVYEGRLETSYTYDETNPSHYTFRYSGTNVSVENGSLDFGLKIRELQGRGSFAATGGQDRPLVIDGRVFVESGTFNRLHLSRGEVDFTVGKELEAVRLARRRESLAGREYAPASFILDRLDQERATRVFQMLIHSDDMYGGTVDGIVYVDTGDLRDMGGELIGKGLQVARASEDVFGRSATNASGTARGSISFRGRSGDQRSITGSGQGFIEDARLAEVPLFFDLLSLLYGENYRRHFFSDVNLRFEIAAGKFTSDSTDGIQILSPTVKLAGGGTMDFRGNLDLLFQTHVLNLKIPVVEQILTLLKKGLAQVSIRGNLSKPQVQFVTGAGMVRIGIGSGGAKEPPPSESPSSGGQETPAEKPTP